MPSKKQRISELGEKKLVKRLLKRSHAITFNSTFFDKSTLKSLSDDAALLNFGKSYLVATTDLLTQSAHFPEEMSYQQIGKKVVTVNVSDLAAMGANSLAITVAMALPPHLALSNFDDIIEGMLQACKQYEMVLIGGDTNEADELTLCGTCLGTVAKDKVMLKSGAETGDVVAVTGPLGLAAAGFEVLFSDDLTINNLSFAARDTVINKALEPEAQLEKGIKLSNSHVVTSATDITDGLLSEIGELVDSSETGIGITFYEELLPIPPEVHLVAEKLDKDPLEMALIYGEDFELLITVQKEKFDELKDDVGLYRIGSVTDTGKIRMVNKEGETNTLTPRGYEHFTRS